ncbi:CDP-glycerol glycerophosphotransferase family protein [Desulfonatronum parangueonense]
MMSPHTHRILFYVERNLHLPFLEPVHDYLAARHPELDLAFSSPAYRPSAMGRVGYGIDPDTVRRLSTKAAYVPGIEDFQPDVTVVSDIGAAYWLRECGSIVNICHNLTSKGCFFTTRPIIRRENLADLICVPGELHAQALEENVFVPIVPTGFITADPLFDVNAHPREMFCQRYGIDPQSKIILFAPTFNDELSAMPLVRERIFELATPKTHVVIKLHGMTDERWIRMYREGSAENPHATYIHDIGVTPCLKAADILISDISSVYVEYLLLDRPILLLDNPRKSEFQHYDPDDIEYRLRDACVVIQDFEELRIKMGQALDGIDGLSGKRCEYARQICHGADGKAAARVGEAIVHHLDRVFPVEFSVIVFWDHPPEEKELLEFWESLGKSTKGYALEVIMAGPRPRTARLTNLATHWIECRHPHGETLDLAVQAAKHDHVALLDPCARCLPGWLKHLYCHLRWNKDAGMAQAIAPGSGYDAVMDKFFPQQKQSSVEEMVLMFNRFLAGYGIRANAVDPTCCLFRKEKFEAVMQPVSERFQSLSARVEELGRTVRRHGQAIITCLDVLAYRAKR